MKYQLKDFLSHLSDLSTISPVAVELINKINLPKTTRREIANLVSKDEILFANVFKCVTSAAFALTRKPRNVLEAIDILGTNEVRNMVFAVAAKKVFVDLDLWYRSVFTAFASQKIAKFKEIDQDLCSDMYIVGLMKSIGEQLFKMFYKEDYQEIVNYKNHEQKLAKEAEVFGINSCQLSFEILKQYGLPERITNLVKNQGISWQDENFTEVNAIIRLAACLGEISSGQDITQDFINSSFDENMIKKFTLEGIELNPELLAQLNSEARAFVNM